MYTTHIGSERIGMFLNNQTQPCDMYYTIINALQVHVKTASHYYRSFKPRTTKTANYVHALAYMYIMYMVTLYFVH
jgi:hypothetical protein